MTLSANKNSRRISQEPWPDGFHVNMPLEPCLHYHIIWPCHWISPRPLSYRIGMLELSSLKICAHSRGNVGELLLLDDYFYYILSWWTYGVHGMTISTWRKVLLHGGNQLRPCKRFSSYPTPSALDIDRWSCSNTWTIWRGCQMIDFASLNAMVIRVTFVTCNVAQGFLYDLLLLLTNILQDDWPKSTMNMVEGPHSINVISIGLNSS